MRPTSAWNFGSLRSATPLARRSARPARTRRCAGCARTPCPGLPRPTMRRIERHYFFSFFSPLSAALLGSRLVAALAALVALGGLALLRRRGLRGGRHVRRRDHGGFGQLPRPRSSPSGSRRSRPSGPRPCAATASTPGGSAMSRRCSEWPACRFAEVDLDELRQVLRQARDLELVHHVLTTPPAPSRRAILRVHEVQRHLHVDLLVLRHALEVGVQDLQRNGCIW